MCLALTARLLRRTEYNDSFPAIHQYARRSIGKWRGAAHVLMEYHESLRQCLQECDENGMGQPRGFTRIGKLASTVRQRGYACGPYPTRHQNMEQTWTAGAEMSAEISEDATQTRFWSI